MNSLGEDSFIYPDWPNKDGVKAVCTTRKGGGSQAPFDSLNVAQHVGDHFGSVEQNRSVLSHSLKLPSQPFWLNQVHGTECLQFSSDHRTPTADASFTTQPKQVLAIMTADCLPILFKSKNGSWIAACHAGWRGLQSGVIENTMATFNGEPSELIAWIGPAISKQHFEVGRDVFDLFVTREPQNQSFFKVKDDKKFWFDFIALARFLMEREGVEVFGGNYCTFHDQEKFFSYRRDGNTGRMVSLIWK
ncbi:peptidoglycan editing factor PgeF [Aliikangiella marina]|uniref:Purine nucleoside phosphorylase n=1 Tax=Aliikangiella marina TaxID=1712262 RepID=A0A545TIG9_9GAMM|nr:peptidoglycan editing factor PgeF [Aliikangiella marina]TQV77015.1 peptidoglycan editing factor PgeF [Aliikangiella marina]